MGWFTPTGTNLPLALRAIIMRTKKLVRAKRSSLFFATISDNKKGFFWHWHLIALRFNFFFRLKKWFLNGVVKESHRHQIEQSVL
jgi:hypothetical protein